MMSLMMSDEEEVDSVVKLHELCVVGGIKVLATIGTVVLAVGGIMVFVVGEVVLVLVSALVVSVVDGITVLVVGGLVVLVKFPSPQDLQHISLYPGIEQYRLNTSILQNTDRSPRQRCLEAVLGAGKSGLVLDNHWMMEFFWSPLQGMTMQVRDVVGRGSVQFPDEPSGLKQAT